MIVKRNPLIATLQKPCFYLTLLLALLIGLSVEAQTPDQSREKVPEDRITVHELKRKLDRKEEIVIIDSRAGNSYLGSSVKIKGSIHITLDELESRMGELPKDKEIVTYCTCPDEATSASMAWTLRENGFNKVKALIGGFDAWEKAGYPVEPKEGK